ncbi:MAG: hypothetical protein HY253_03660 [Burkholderiales bacterium]|nr:hypothetical protein [Burkholderiales bacterium]
MAALCGLIFGLGLLLSGMANPAIVIAFLDLAGQWNPSLAFVMIGAIGTAVLPFALLKKRGTSLLNETLHLPRPRKIDWRLLAGSALFGIGWGWSGICPGPAIVLLGINASDAAIFVAAMLVGIYLVDRFLPYRST